MGFRDAVAIVTGGASGIGQALSEALAEQGAVVLLADRNETRARAAAQAIVDRGGRAHAACLDVRDAGAFRALAARVRAEHGRIDYLFNNAGIAWVGTVDEHEPLHWDEIVDVNLRGVVHGVLAVYPILREQGFGHLVNTASVAGLLPVPGIASYVMTKHAVVGLSRSLRIEARHYGVKVTALCPAFVRTPILDGGEFGDFLGEGRPEGHESDIERLRPMDVHVYARQALRDVAKNRAVSVRPTVARLLWWLDRISPALGERLFSVVHRGTLKRREAARAAREAQMATR